MNKKVDSIEISGIRKFYNKVREVEGAISLTLGQPDFPLLSEIKEGINKALIDNKTVYTENAGIEELREEISKYLKNLKIEYSKDEIIVTVGGSEAIYSVFQGIVNEGDKILVPNPAYPAYENILKIVGGEIVNYKLDENFNICIESLENQLKLDKYKAIVLSFPTNPTGAILDREKRDKLVALLKDRDIIVITDEIYASIIYEDYYSVAQSKELIEKTIYISGFSKMFSATGLRVGYVCGKGNLLENAMKVHQYGISCAPSICQYGILEGMKNGMEKVELMKNEFYKRKEYVVSRLKNMGVDTINPKGAFYVFPSIKKFNMTSEEFCTRLLKEGKVACVPGTAFGSLGEGYMRISYCYSHEELKEALDRIENFINNLK